VKELEVKKEPEVKDEPKEDQHRRRKRGRGGSRSWRYRNAACHPDDHANVPGLHLLQARLFSEIQPMEETTAVLWSAEQSGNLIDLTKDDGDMPEVKEEF
jgi:hypothetical protein